MEKDLLAPAVILFHVNFLLVTVIVCSTNQLTLDGVGLFLLFRFPRLRVIVVVTSWPCFGSELRCKPRVAVSVLFDMFDLSWRFVLHVTCRLVLSVKLGCLVLGVRFRIYWRHRHRRVPLVVLPLCWISFIPSLNETLLFSPFKKSYFEFLVGSVKARGASLSFSYSNLFVCSDPELFAVDVYPWWCHPRGWFVFHSFPSWNSIFFSVL